MPEHLVTAGLRPNIDHFHTVLEQLPEFGIGLVPHVDCVAIYVHPPAFREQRPDPVQDHQQLPVRQAEGVPVTEEHLLHPAVPLPGIFQVFQYFFHRSDPELLVLEHTAKSTAVMGTADGHLHQQAPRLAGRTVNISFVTHYILSGALTASSARPFFRVFFAARVSATFAFFSASSSTRICSS